MKLFLLGGFLGSGKTTAIHQACVQLLEDKKKTGVITNDQGMQLVDTAFIKHHQIAGKEVVNGCFCCNYSHLEKAIRSLQKEDNPEIVFAESVGSCTDIVATVIKPLQKFYSDLEMVYPVFADACTLLKKVHGEELFFDDDVVYIFEKQLEEADILIVNKTDLLTKEEEKAIREMLVKQFPGKPLLFQSSLQNEDIKKWLKTLLEFDPPPERKSLQIDYDKYASGEARLAWLDAELVLFSEINAMETAVKLINRIYEKIRQRKYPLGHLKFLIRAGQWQRKISFTSLNEPVLKQTRSFRNIEELDLLVNARVQTTPDALQQLFSEAANEIMENDQCKIENKGQAVFQPGYPRPEHRIER